MANAIPPLLSSVNVDQTLEFVRFVTLQNGIVNIVPPLIIACRDPPVHRPQSMHTITRKRPRGQRERKTNFGLLNCYRSCKTIHAPTSQRL